MVKPGDLAQYHFVGHAPLQAKLVDIIVPDLRAVERIVNGLGFTCVREGVNAVEAWLSSLPGHTYANVQIGRAHV